MFLGVNKKLPTQSEFYRKSTTHKITIDTVISKIYQYHRNGEGETIRGVGVFFKSAERESDRNFRFVSAVLFYCVR